MHVGCHLVCAFFRLSLCCIYACTNAVYGNASTDMCSSEHVEWFLFLVNIYCMCAGCFGALVSCHSWSVHLYSLLQSPVANGLTMSSVDLPTFSTPLPKVCLQCACMHACVLVHVHALVVVCHGPYFEVSSWHKGCFCFFTDWCSNQGIQGYTIQFTVYTVWLCLWA